MVGEKQKREFDRLCSDLRNKGLLKSRDEIFEIMMNLARREFGPRD